MLRSLTRLRTSQAVGAAVVAITALALAGPRLGMPWLTTWDAAGAPVMTALGALLLAVPGLLLMFSLPREITLAAGIGIASVAVADLCLKALGVEPHEPWRMAVTVTSICLVCLGTAFALASVGRGLVAAMLAVFVAAIAAFALLGYLSGVGTLYNVTTIVAQPVPDAVSLLLIAIGVLLQASADPVLQQPRPLWHLLAALGGAIAVPLLLFGAYAGAHVVDAQVNQVRQGLMDEARSLSAEVDRDILGEIETLQALAASPSLQRSDFEAFQRQAEAPLTLRHEGNIMLVDRGLQEIVNTSAPFGTPLPRTEMIAGAVETAFATGRRQVTSLFRAPVTHQVTFAIVIPVTINGEIRYVLSRMPSQLALDRVVAASGLTPGRSAVIFDANHRIIATSRTGAEAVGAKLPEQRRRREGSGGVLEFTDDNGQSSLQAWAVSEVTGWGSAVSASSAVLGAPLRPLWRALVVMALFAVSLVLGLALWVGRIISASVGHAARAAVAVGEGRPPPISETPIAEVNTLMDELRVSEAKLAAAAGSLRDSERQLQLALVAAELGFWEYEPRRGMVSGGDRGRELLGIDAAEVPCERVLALVDPDDRNTLTAALAASLAGHGPARAAVEFRVRPTCGSARWLEILWLTRSEGTSREATSLVGTVADVTARKEIEEERRARAEREHLLMREMNHRAKNLLSVVDAIAHQTASTSPDDFVKRFSSRIQSLSANQDLLFGRDANGVDILSLVHAQLAHFADLIPARIAASGPRLRLTPPAAQAIGLALHELATNAGKYGALSTPSGRVDISWNLGPEFAMSWVESGGPRVTAPTRLGFGSVLMGRMVGRSVGGTVDLDYPPTGMTWRLTCPAANVLEGAATTGPETAVRAGGPRRLTAS